MDIWKWYNKQSKAFKNRRVYNILEVKGTMASKNFLTILSHKLALNWASNELVALIKNEHLGWPTNTLEEYRRVFSGIAQEFIGVKQSKAPGIFAIIGNCLDSKLSDPNSNPSKAQTWYNWPCYISKKKKHTWKPKDYVFLEQAITRTTT